MTNRIDSSSSLIVFEQEFDRLISLSTHIAQMVDNIRLIHLSNLSYSPENIETCYETLLSMAENIEGSAILLESLLFRQQHEIPSMKKINSTRLHYTRDELFYLRQYVTSDLSDQIGYLLKQVVELESNDVVESDRQSWRDIRTILM
ncbi:hypothetical protein I4U23_010275 [Adineta vaga]|nr:hypothetical protein I4U23_010275 [Adineta vaga]